MEHTTIARSYAAALFSLAEQAGEFESFARAFASVNTLVEHNPIVRDFLRSPKIDVAEKKRVLRSSLENSVPPLFLNFLMVVLDKRRQRLLREMAREFDLMMDERLGRLNVQVTLAHRPDDAELRDISARLSKLTGRTVTPHVQIDGDILGGIIVRYGDRMLDGSLRRRLLAMRSLLMDAPLATQASRTPTS